MCAVGTRVESGGGSSFIAVVLVLSTITPLLAGVVMSLRLPAETHVHEAETTRLRLAGALLKATLRAEKVAWRDFQRDHLN